MDNDELLDELRKNVINELIQICRDEIEGMRQGLSNNDLWIDFMELEQMKIDWLEARL